VNRNIKKHNMIKREIVRSYYLFTARNKNSPNNNDDDVLRRSSCCDKIETLLINPIMDGGGEGYYLRFFRNRSFYSQSWNRIAIKHSHLFALWDADFDPKGRNQHPTRQRERILA